MQQAPKWLPFRFRHRLDQARINRALRGILNTRPYLAADPSEADAEVSMLLCRRDLRVGLVALKSLMRFNEGRWAVTIINDGTLDEELRRVVDRHIPNAHWTTWKKANDPHLTAAFEKYPRLASLYRDTTYEPSAKLLHPLVLNRCPRIVQVDSDTAFFASPERIIRFCRGDDSRPLYLHDRQDESKKVPPQAHEAFASLAKYVAPDRPWRLAHRFFNAGLLIFRADQMDLALAERYLEWVNQAPPEWTTGKLTTWFGPWKTGSGLGREQTAYHTMFAFADPPAEPLGSDYLLGGASAPVFCHFLRHYVVQSWTLNNLRKLIREL